MDKIQSNSIYLSNKSLVCRVCGDIARGNNFQVPTCMSCKSFFRRNALQPLGTLRCFVGNRCLITEKTRNRCPACRLRKCFQSGMNPKLIRQINNQRIIHTNYLSQSKDQSLNLLQEQIFLSNLFFNFDKIKSNNLSSLPPKLRFKSVQKLNKINTIFNMI